MPGHVKHAPDDADGPGAFVLGGAINQKKPEQGPGRPVLAIDNRQAVEQANRPQSSTMPITTAWESWRKKAPGEAESERPPPAWPVRRNRPLPNQL